MILGSDEERRRYAERKRRLQQTFLDLANRFVASRMKFLRFTGAQPPDERDPGARKP